MPKFLSILLVCVFMATQAQTVHPVESEKYPNLVKLLSLPGRTEGYIAFTDYSKRYEETVYNSSRDYFNTHPQLIQQISKDLDSNTIQWQLQDLSHRLLYLPEDRKAVAGLFAAYCREAVQDLLTHTGFANPYSSISVILDEIPEISEGKSIKAFIVQNLAQEYIAQYRFQGNNSKKIEIDLSGRIALNEVGSYSSHLNYSEETRQWKFTGDRHTVWKSTSANPYTVLMTPLEETLHICLRQYTEKAIMEADIFKNETVSVEDVQKAADDWLCVEEAIVGGLVHTLAPDIVIKRIPDLPREWIETDLETKAKFEKYHLLPKAIEVVKNYGIRESIQLYSRDPNAFRNLLMNGAGKY